MVGDSVAEDVLPEVSLGIYRQIGLLREQKAFRAWAYRIATRIAEEQDFLRNALAGVERAARIQWIKQMVVTVIAFPAVYFLMPSAIGDT